MDNRVNDYDKRRVSDRYEKSMRASLDKRPTHRSKRKASKIKKAIKSIILVGMAVVTITGTILVSTNPEGYKEATKDAIAMIDDKLTDKGKEITTNHSMENVSGMIGSLVLGEDKENFIGANTDEIKILTQCTYQVGLDDSHKPIIAYDLNKAAGKVWQLDKDLVDYAIAATLNDMGANMNRNANDFIRALKILTPDYAKEDWEDINSLEDYLSKKGANSFDELCESLNEWENVRTIMSIVESYKDGLSEGVKQNGNI